MKKLYILTLTWKACGKLAMLYRSLLPAIEGLDWEWIIKDNNSGDGTLEEIASWKNDRIKVIAYPNNLQNFSEGVNACFHFANPNDDDLVLLLNNDIIFNDTTSIKKMIDLLKDDVGIVGARLLYTGSKVLQHCGVIIDDFSALPMHFRGNQLSDKAAEMNREFQAVTGALMLLKAGDFRKICDNKDKSGRGGLSEKLIWCFDDVDACFAVKYNLGKRIIYCGSTNVFHEESATLKVNPVNKLFMSYNVNYFRTKWGTRYIRDKSLYEKDPNYNLYKAK